jgi:hypothetical protein
VSSGLGTIVRNISYILKKQLVDYLERLSLNSGWLMIFSRGNIKDWKAVGKREQHEVAGFQIEVIWL